MTEVAQSDEVGSRAAQDASAADNVLGVVKVSLPSSVTVVGLESDSSDTDQCTNYAA